MSYMRSTEDPFSQLALAIEYPWRYGGSQRLASILAKKLKKRLYLISEGKHKKITLCWDIRPLRKIPKEKIIFSIVVNKYFPVLIPGKCHIKFLHSAGTIEFLKNCNSIKDFYWITHRKRVYEYGKELGLRVYIIPDGYILYDKQSLPKIDIENKKDIGISVSRIDSLEKIRVLAQISKSTKLPVYIIGSPSNKEYSHHINNLPRTVSFFGKISEKQKSKLLKECKILIHYSKGKLRDYLEYSILDGMLYGCIPVCISPDPKQFNILEEKNIGKNVSNLADVKKAIEEILSNYSFYYKNVRKFMEKFIKKQPLMFKRWKKTLEIIVRDVLQERNIC